jgi:ABC-type microcin C transport system permease subunit YejE
MMLGSIILFGLLAVPFAGLNGQSYAYLNAISVLYCFLTTIQGVYTVIEASYIPIFMRSVGWRNERPITENVDDTPQQARDKISKTALIKGYQVSVLGLLSSNIGSLLALLIGVIITYTRGSYVTAGYEK